MTATPRRRSVHVDGLAHGATPIPNAAVLRGVVCTGGISGFDRVNGRYPDSIDAEAACMFDNLRAVLAASGASTDDIVKLTVFLLDRADRAAIDVEWAKEFPDRASRPARHSLVLPLPPPMRMQCEALAVIQEGVA